METKICKCDFCHSPVIVGEICYCQPGGIPEEGFPLGESEMIRVMLATMIQVTGTRGKGLAEHMPRIGALISEINEIDDLKEMFTRAEFWQCPAWQKLKGTGTKKRDYIQSLVDQVTEADVLRMMCFREFGLLAIEHKVMPLALQMQTMAELNVTLTRIKRVKKMHEQRKRLVGGENPIVQMLREMGMDVTVIDLT